MVLVGLFLTLTLGFRVLRLGVLVSGLAFGLEFRVFVLFRAQLKLSSRFFGKQFEGPLPLHTSCTWTPFAAGL